MALSNVTTLNTFTEWMVRDNQVIVELNRMLEGVYRTSGNVTITGTTVSGDVLANVVGILKTTTMVIGDGSLSRPSIARSAGANVGIYFPSTNAMSFVTASNAVMSLIATGNVGIGIAAPTSKLEIEGTFKANGRSHFGANVGIGKASPAYPLDVVGDIFSTGQIISESDIRIKENIEPITDALDLINRLNGVTYNKKFNTRRELGMIAQEVQKIIPAIVHSTEDNMLGISYPSVIAVLIEAVKDLTQKLVNIEKQIDGRRVH